MILNLPPYVRLVLTAVVAGLTAVATALPAPYQAVAQVLLVVLAAVGIVPPVAQKDEPRV